MKVSTDKLRVVTGLVLAKKARIDRRYKLKTGYVNTAHYLQLASIKWLVVDALTGYKAGDIHPDSYWTVSANVTEGRLRAALKWWEMQKKIDTKRGGRYGNSYRWLLKAETNYWDRVMRKRKAREAQQEKDKEQRERETHYTQLIADQLGGRFGLEAGSFKAWGGNITITQAQAQAMILFLWGGALNA